MPEAIWSRKGTDPMPEELQAILSERLRALEWVASTISVEGYVPVSRRHGWKGNWKALKRDRDGSLLVRITVSTPECSEPYTRLCRLVARDTLISRLRSELRES